jgi:hypothetical protein
MTELIVETLVGLLALFVWVVVSSVLVRPFGVRLPLAPFSFAKRRLAVDALAFTEYLVIVGILYFGCGMLITKTVSHYIQWKYWHGPPITADKLFRDFWEYALFTGVLFGCISWATRSGDSRK